MIIRYFTERKSSIFNTESNSALFSSFTISKVSVTEGSASSTPEAMFALSSAASYSIFSPVFSSIFLILLVTTDSILSGFRSIVSVFPAIYSTA